MPMSLEEVSANDGFHAVWLFDGINMYQMLVQPMDPLVVKTLT